MEKMKKTEIKKGVEIVQSKSDANSSRPGPSSRNPTSSSTRKPQAGSESSQLPEDNSTGFRSLKSVTFKNPEWISPTGKIQVFPLDKLTDDESLKNLEVSKKVYNERLKELGESHPSTLSTLNTVALVNFKLRNYSEALALYQKVEEKRIQVLGPNHPNVLTTKHNKACVLYKMGQIEEAATIFHEIYKKYKETLGENHVDTIGALEWIGGTLKQEGKLEEALGIYKRVHEIRKRDLGMDHPDTILIKRAIGDVESKIGQKNKK